MLAPSLPPSFRAARWAILMTIPSEMATFWLQFSFVFVIMLFYPEKFAIFPLGSAPIVKGDGVRDRRIWKIGPQIAARATSWLIMEASSRSRGHGFDSHHVHLFPSFFSQKNG